MRVALVSAVNVMRCICILFAWISSVVLIFLQSFSQARRIVTLSALLISKQVSKFIILIVARYH